MQQAVKKKRVPKLAERLEHLLRLEQMVVARQEALVSAMVADWGHRSHHESLMSDIFTVVKAARYARAHLAEWMEPEDCDVDMTFFPARAEVLYQPLGVVGIIAPWNYPVQLALVPLIDALAAGNRAIIKPSELVPKTSALLAEMIEQLFAADHVRVVQGGVELSAAMSAMPFDHLIFTGSTKVGKLVMRAAAEHLTPVTLELGGKSPAILGENYPMKAFAESVVAGKLFNAGQTCIAPDYVIVPRGQAEAFGEAFAAVVAQRYPKLVENDDYSAVIHARHKQRLQELVREAEAKGASCKTINPAGESDDNSPKMLPVLVFGAPDEAALMQEEIFGPVLPVIEVDSLADAIAYVNDRPRPLALYYFDRRGAQIEHVLTATISGGVCINDTLFHQVQESLPFGGVGASGMGHYHGRDGFVALSKRKPVFYQSRLNGAGMLRPPYGKTIERALRFLIGK